VLLYGEQESGKKRTNRVENEPNLCVAAKCQVGGGEGNSDNIYPIVMCTNWEQSKKCIKKMVVQFNSLTRVRVLSSRACLACLSIVPSK
jgi:hypothetical protein